jgi:hypothetical protein
MVSSFPHKREHFGNTALLCACAPEYHLLKSSGCPMTDMSQSPTLMRPATVLHLEVQRLQNAPARIAKHEDGPRREGESNGDA